MWMFFISSRDARELCSFYVKMAVVIIFIFHNLIYQSKGHELVRKKGSYCSSNMQCDPSRFLQCSGVESTCDCHKVVDELWVPEEDTCMIKEGGSCGRRMNEAKCITNSSCIAGKCVCDDGFLRNGFDKCEISYGGTCSESEKCASRYMLECIKNEKSSRSECMCRNEFVWDEKRQKCVSMAGGSCVLPGSLEFDNDDKIECMKNAHCVGFDGGSTERGTCLCDDGFTQTQESTCMLQFGAQCNQYTQCDRHQFLVCRERKCDCEFFGQMKYDNVTKQCSWLVGENCYPKGNKNNNDNHLPLEWADCITDSFCKPRPQSRRGICTCVEGMVKMSDNTCSRYNKGHGEKCSTSIDCDKGKYLECVLNENEGSRCDCFKDMVYNGKKCVVHSGRNCTENKSCVENAYCEGDWCVCPMSEGYKIDGPWCVPDGRNRARNLPNKQQNGHASTFPSFSPLNCNEFSPESIEWIRCHCQTQQIKTESPTHIWIEEKNACLTLVGIKCEDDSDCVPHAVCDENEKLCQCSSVAYTTPNGTCNVRSANSNHDKDLQSPDPDCTNTHSLKSIGSKDESQSSKASSYTSGITLISVIVLLNGR